MRQSLQRLRDPVGVGQHGRLAPLGGRGQGAHRLDRLPFLLGDHREIAPLAHDLDHAGHPLDRPGVERGQNSPVARRAHDAGVQHVRQAQVLHIGRPARELGRDVHPRHRAADDGEAARAFQRARRLGLHVQRQALGERAVADPPAVRRDHHAVAHRQLLDRRVQPLRRRLQQHRPRLGRGVHDRRAAVLHRVAARREHLVRGAGGVGGDQGDLAADRGPAPPPRAGSAAS